MQIIYILTGPNRLNSESDGEKITVGLAKVQIVTCLLEELVQMYRFVQE